MSKKQVASTIDLNELAGGAFAEKLNEALVQIGENIQNPNTDAVTKRRINITLTLAPNKTRNLVNTTIAVTTKLAATEAIDTQMIMGVNMRTGKLEIAEYDGQIPGQMSLAQIEQAAAQEVKQAAAQVNAALDKIQKDQEAAEAAVEDPAPTQPAGKPLDLRKRNKPDEVQEAPEPVPGKDFDPETGEVLEDNTETPITGKIVVMKAAEA